MNQKRIVRDFFRGIKIFGLTIGYPLLVVFILLMMMESNDIQLTQEQSRIADFVLMFAIGFPFVLGTVGFIVNYTPLKVVGDTVSIPATDQIRTFIDLIILNPITGLYRRREYNVNDIENVANGYTRVKRGKEREWNVVITGMKNGKSFSQRIDCSNKQVRDEVRNVLKLTIKGRVNSDFAV